MANDDIEDDLLIDRTEVFTPHSVYLAALHTLAFVNRPWFAHAVAAEHRRYMMPLLVGLYVAYMEGRLLTIKETAEIIQADHSRTIDRYVELGRNLGLVFVQKSHNDKRNRYVVPTDKLIRLVENEMWSVRNEIRNASDAITDEMRGKTLARKHKYGTSRDPNPLSRLAGRGLFPIALYRESHQETGAVVNFKRFIEDLSEAIRLMPRNKRALLNRAFSYVITSDYEKAVEDYDALLDLDSDNVEAREGRAGLLRQALEVKKELGGMSNEQMKEQIEADYTSAIKSNPDADHLYAARGAFFKSIGRDAEGERDIAKAAELRMAQLDEDDALYDLDDYDGTESNDD